MDTFPSLLFKWGDCYFSWLNHSTKAAGRFGLSHSWCKQFRPKRNIISQSFLGDLLDLKNIFILVKFLFHTNINGTATHWLPQSFPLLFNFNSITVPIGYGEWMDKQDRDPLTWPIGYAAAPHNHAIMVSSSVSLILLSSTQLKRWTQTDLCVYEYNVPLNLIKDGPYFPL